MTSAAVGSPGQVPGDGGREAWARGIIGWHLAFWLLWVLSVAATALGAGWTENGPPLTTLALLAVMALAYLLLGQAAAGRQRPWHGRAYVVVAVLTLSVLFWVSPGLSFLLFLAFPQMWMLTTTRAEGVVASVALAAGTASAFALRDGTRDGAVASFLSLGVSLLFSLLLGLWITSIIGQSRRRADLIAELEATRSHLAKAHHDAGVVAERERLAREIHDTIAQGLTSVVMLSQVAQRRLAEAGGDGGQRGAAGGREGIEAARSTVATIEDVARANLADARALVASYAAVGVQDGLAAALRRLGARFAAETGAAVRVDIDLPDGEPTTAGRSQVVLLRAVQEGLANVRRHAGAGHVVVTLGRRGDGDLAVEVRDDGVGFDPGAVRPGFGLDGLRARAGEVGGDVAVTAGPDGGTVLRVAVPGG